MHKVTIEHFPGIDLGDTRRDERFVSIINTISTQPDSSIPRQNKRWYDTKATYSFFKNTQVSLKALRQAMMSYGAQQVADKMALLVVHDITNVSFATEAEGLGYLDNKHGRGLLGYSSIAVSPEGLPLSLLYQYTWVRPKEELGKGKKRKERKFEDKESYRWYDGIQQTNQLLGEQVHKIHIADRQADIYDVFFQSHQTNTDLLIRASINRKEASGSPVWDLVSQQPAAGKVVLDIPDPAGKKRLPVEAEVRFQPVRILRPMISENEYESVNLVAIEITELSSRKEEDKIHWKLLTSIDVKTVTEVLQCVKWYTYRWLIERFHYVLKNGTKLESLQLKQAESLQKALMVYSISAFRIMQFVYLSRKYPHVSCEVILTTSQWKVLYILIHKKNNFPEQPPTLELAVKWIGQLGGHLGRKSDGPPGLKTVWYGYLELCNAERIHQLTTQNLGNE